MFQVFALATSERDVILITYEADQSSTVKIEDDEFFDCFVEVHLDSAGSRHTTLGTRRADTRSAPIDWRGKLASPRTNDDAGSVVLKCLP